MQKSLDHLQQVSSSLEMGSAMRITILLITNRDSDNLGDQVIEACDISLINAVMDNLDISPDEVEIRSRALAIVPNKYCATDDRQFLETAENEVSTCTFVLFGGAPVFNYAYQVFYKKTATILNLAKKHNKPVIFSAVGIDSYDQDNERCQLLKASLQNGMVRQITTRDGIEHLHEYARHENDDSLFPISLVSDPAVFASTVFSPFLTEREISRQTPLIGVFVFRSAGFRENKVDFTLGQQCIFWRDLFRTLNARGFEYEVLTSGHFSDEAMLQYLIEEGIVHRNKCVRTLNTPEDLLARISSYDGVIACRLHPSIISFSCNVPSVGIIWNSKVADFYRHIGYKERAISIEQFIKGREIDASVVVDALEEAIAEGISKNSEYITSVYRTLLTGIASCLNKDIAHVSMYELDELERHLSRYLGTSAEQEHEKIERKAIRCYRMYNEDQLRIATLLNNDDKYYPIIFHSGGKGATPITTSDPNAFSQIELLSSGNLQCRARTVMTNDGTSSLSSCLFSRANTNFIGWKIRFRVDNKWFWIVNGGGEYIQKLPGNKVDAQLFKPGAIIPHVAVNHINVMVAEAEWCSPSYEIRFNSGRRSGDCSNTYVSTDGALTRLPSGSIELIAVEKVSNLRPSNLLKNSFSYPGFEFNGWHIRVKVNGKWSWILADGQLISNDKYDKKMSGSLKLFEDGQEAPRFELSGVSMVVAEATWRKPDNQTQSQRSQGGVFRKLFERRQ